MMTVEQFDKACFVRLDYMAKALQIDPRRLLRLLRANGIQVTKAGKYPVVFRDQLDAMPKLVEAIRTRLRTYVHAPKRPSGLILE